MMVALAGFLFYKQIIRTSQITIRQTSTPLISANIINIPTSESEQMLGNPGATTTIVEFVDLNCARCLATHSIIKKFVIQHPQAIRMIWKDAVKPGIFSNFTLAHQAAYCAGKQNKFWEFIDTATANQNNLSEPGLKTIAQNLKLDLEPWWQCTNNPETIRIIADSVKTADQLGVRSLPAIFINNKIINTDKDVNIEELMSRFIGK